MRRVVIPVLSQESVTVNSEQRAALTVVSKVLQKVVNQQTYTHTQRNFLPFNQFISNSVKPMFRYLDWISDEAPRMCV